MSRNAVQIATQAAGGVVSIATIRDPADGTAKFTVVYQSRGTYWQSCHRFQDVDHAQAGALALADFIGAEVRL